MLATVGDWRSPWDRNWAMRTFTIPVVLTLIVITFGVFASC